MRRAARWREEAAPRVALVVMQIALVRHGRPKLATPPEAAGDMDGWVAAYDRAGIDPALPPPARLRRRAAAAHYLVSSDLPRAVESLRALAPERRASAERLFREAGLPRIPAPPVRIDPALWAALARVPWWIGWPDGGESLARARRRAGAAATRLAELAVAHGSVLLVGHGILNALIAWELRDSGWRGPFWPTGRYWSVATYRRRAVRSRVQPAPGPGAQARAGARRSPAS